MSDNFEPINLDPTTPAVPAADIFEYVNPVPQPVAETTDDDDLFSSDETVGFVAPDPNAVIILRFSSGDTKYVPATEPLTISAAMGRAQLATIPGAVTYYLNGAEVGADTLVPLGQTVTVIGSVKGG